MSVSRNYTSRRTSITSSLVDLFRSINGTGTFLSDVSGNVYPYLKFLSDMADFPAICVVAGQESRDYQSSGYKDRYLSFRIIIFVSEENPLTRLDAVLEDIETLIEDNGRLLYKDKLGQTQATHDITVLSLSTDEGTLDPIAIGEMSVRVHY